MIIEKYGKDNIYVTSDTHFRHRRIIELCNRPFGDVEEMNEVMIVNWNRVVQPNDHVFHLGDFALGGIDEWSSILERLNGKIHLILGNHDLRTISQGCPNEFVEVCMQKIIAVGKRQIILNHYPMLCFSCANKKTWQLFGHVHSSHDNIENDTGRLSMLYPAQYDVGVDNNDFTPVSYFQIEEIIRTQVEMNNN